MRRGTFGDAMTPIEASRHPYVEWLLGQQICEAALAAERGGYDAVAVNCFYDPALRQARALVDIPVVSLFESCVLTACSLGRSIGLVALNEDQSAMHHELVAEYGLERRFTGTVPMRPVIDEYMLEGGEAETAAITTDFRQACAALLYAAGVLIHHAAFLAGLRRDMDTSPSRVRHYAKLADAMLRHARQLERREAAAEDAFSGSPCD